MSKIPQGEWSAIAARYAKGESITRIAQSYGCTPPAIHYILKRSRLRAAQNPEQRVNGMPGSATSVPGEPQAPLQRSRRGSIANCTGERKPPSRPFARASTRRSSRDRPLSANACAKPHRI